MREYFQTLQEEYEQIVSNQISKFEPGLSLEQFSEACKTIESNLRNLRDSTKQLLADQIEPILQKVESFTDEEEAELYAAAQKLSSFEARQDPGFALKIYKSLLQRARTRKDDAKIVKYLYWCGITQFFFYGNQNDTTRELVFFEEGATYADKYHTFEDPETRQYVHRCLGNTSMCYYTNRIPEKAMELEEGNFSFWNNLIFTGKDPDFPWLNYFLNGLNHRYSSYSREVFKDPNTVPKEIYSKILDVAITSNKLYHKNREYYNVFGGTRYDSHLWEAQFLSGLISFDLLLENVKREQAALAPDDYSANAMYIMIQLNADLLFYASTIDSLKSRKDEVVKELSKSSIEYLSRIPKTVDPETVNVQLRELARCLGVMFSPEEHLDFILKMTIYRHGPTYAHSIMVGKVAVLLTKYLIENDPDCFIGCLDIADREEVSARAEELYEFAEISGLCHDIGKIACIDNPYMHIRVLTDEEYKIIQRHPVEGARIMGRDDETTLHKGYIDVIAGHHKYYDNTAGYPESFDISESKHRMMVDIISVANSLVAATDHISRTYSDVKTFLEVCNEIRKGSGTRYSPVVAGLLDDKVFLSELEQLLNEERIKAYYTAYQYV